MGMQFPHSDLHRRHDPNERPQAADIIKCLRVLRVKMETTTARSPFGGKVSVGGGAGPAPPSCGCSIS